MRSTRPLAAGLLAFLALLLTGPRAILSGAPQGEGFTLAVVRRDAIVLPIATYDGQRWKNSWPRPQSKVTAPIGLIDIPRRWWSDREPIARWTFWPIQGASREIETIGPAWYPAHCAQGVGLRTTYAASAPPPPPNVHPYPKDGLAAAGAASITQFEILDAPSAPIARELEQTLAPRVSTDETQYLKVLHRMSPSWAHSYDEEARKATPITIEAVYRVPRGLGDRDVYYFEGFKQYAVRPPPPRDTRGGREDQPPEGSTPAVAGLETDTGNRQGAPRAADGQSPASPPSASATGHTPPAVPACDLVTFVSGFFTRRAGDKEPGRIGPLNLQVVPTSCDFENAQILLPLAVVHVRDRALWVVQWSGPRQEFYAVLDIEDEQVRQVAWAGGGGCAARD